MVNTATQLVGRGISALTTFVITLLIARQFGASGFGDFVKVTTYAAFFYLLADFGINAIYLQRDVRDHWASLVTLRLLGGIALVMLALFILYLLPGSATQGYTETVRLGILFFSPTILLQGFITTTNAIFQKHFRYDLATWAIFFGSIATIILLWLLVYGAHSTNMLVVIGAVAVGTLVTTLSSFLFASRLVGTVRFSPTFAQMKQLFVPSIPLGITLLFNLVYFHADSVILTLTRPTAEVGVYGLAYKMFEVILVFPTFFMNAVYPVMLQTKNDTRKAASKQFKKILMSSAGFLFLVSLFSLLLLWVAAPLVTFVKSDFAPSIGAIRILSLGLPFFFVTAATMWGLITLKKQKILAGIYGVSMFVNIIGNILLIPTYGFVAAAWMTVAGEGIVLVLSILVLLKNF